MQATRYYPIRVTGDWGLLTDDGEIEESFAAWWDGETWNGWATPLFETAEAQRYAEVQTLIARQKGGIGEMTYSLADDAFVSRDESEGELDYWPGFDIEIDGRSVHVYGIGTRVWCWVDASRWATAVEAAAAK